MSRIELINCDYVSLQNLLNKIGAENIIAVLNDNILTTEYKVIFLVIYKENANE